MADKQNIKMSYVCAGDMGNNSYILYADDREDCVVIDTAGDGSEIIQALQKLGRKPALLLLTHGHFDHIMGLPKLREAYEMPVAIHKDEAHALSDPEMNLSMLTGRPLKMPDAEMLLEDGQRVESAGIDLEVIHTPGHSPGSVSFLCGNAVFSGDTLFQNSVGRTDFPGSSLEELIASLGRLFALEGNLDVFPGHSGFSTLDAERRGNFFVRQYAPGLMEK